MHVSIYFFYMYMPSLMIACNITGIFDTCTFGYLSDTQRKTFTSGVN